MGRARTHYCPRDTKGHFRSGYIMTAYVREGTPSKWRAIAKVCTTCLQFWPKNVEARKLEEARP